MVTQKARIRQAYEVCARGIVSGETSLALAEEAGFRISLPIFPVGHMARLANVHPQTLREYDRLGLVRPHRTPGGARRYSLVDVQRLTEAEKLAQESIGIAGIRRILALSEENRKLRRELRRLRRRRGSTIFASDPNGITREYSVAPGSRRWRSGLYGRTLAIETRHALKSLVLMKASSPLEIETRRHVLQIEGTIVDDADASDAGDAASPE